MMITAETLDWKKGDSLIPAIIQDDATLQVLMMGYMNQEALQQTIETRQVTFFSRTKKRLWTKGETSGHVLTLVNIIPDCDNDTLLILVKPSGPSCHLNNRSCFGKEDSPGIGILAKLEATINQRYRDRPAESYVATLFNEGVQRIAQKVGEEGVEVALASVMGSRDEIINEAADLIFHWCVLLRACGVEMADVMRVLNHRHGLLSV